MENSTKAITFNRLPILGKDKVSFEEWHFSYERWCKANKIEEEEDKIEYLISLTTDIARTIVFNSLNKEAPDSYKTIINKLRGHFRVSTSKNARLLELSTVTIKKGERISEFDVRFNTLCNQVNLEISDQVITSYYINAFKNWGKIYEALLEEEPTSLQDAMKITSKKGKIIALMEENKNKYKKLHGVNKKEIKDFNESKNYNNNYNNYNYRNDYFSTSNSRSNNKQYNNNNNNYNRYDNKNKHNDNYNNNIRNNRYKMQSREEINKGIEHRMNTLRYPQSTIEDLDDITKKLEQLKINFCVQCKRIGHKMNDCPENDESHLN